MEASEATGGNGEPVEVNPSAEEEVLKLQERVTQLEKEVVSVHEELAEAQAKIAALEGAESGGEVPPPPPTESEKVKKLKEQLANAESRLTEAEALAQDDRTEISRLQAEISAAEADGS